MGSYIRYTVPHVANDQCLESLVNSIEYTQHLEPLLNLLGYLFLSMIKLLDFLWCGVYHAKTTGVITSVDYVKHVKIDFGKSVTYHFALLVRWLLMVFFNIIEPSKGNHPGEIQRLDVLHM